MTDLILVLFLSFDEIIVIPRIVQVSPLGDEVIQREVGSSVRLKCESTGKPKPSINWFHNHNLIQASREESRKGRWTLVIYDLKLEDSGNYSCFIVNPYGNVSASFILDVVGSCYIRIYSFFHLVSSVSLTSFLLLLIHSSFNHHPSLTFLFTHSS